MSLPSSPFDNEFVRHQGSGELMKDYRVRLEMEEQERLERKRREREELRSDSRTPDARIRAWEQFHGLRLPSDPTHPVVQVIVSDTRLTLEEVVAEQQARAARTAAQKPR